MKSSLFKKVIAGAATLAMASQFAFAIPASAEDLLTATYSNGKLTLSQAAAADYVAIVATYDENNALVKATPYDIKQGVQEIEITANDDDKIMVWDGFAHCKPVTSAVTVEPEATVKPTVAPTIDPSKIFSKSDFESETAGTVSVATNAKKDGDFKLTLNNGTVWNSQYANAAGDLLVKSDNTKYISFNNSSGRGPRTAYAAFSSDEQKLNDDKKSVLECDFYMGGGAGSQFIVMDSSIGTPIGNGNYAGGAEIFALYKTDANTLVTGIDGSDTSNATTGYNSGWAHLKAVMDFADHTVVLKITSVDGATTYLDETKISMKNQKAEKIGKMFVAQNRAVGATFGVDNIMVRDVLDGDVAGVYYLATFVTPVDKTNNKETTSINTSALNGTTIKADSVPDTTNTGYIFKGWQKDDDTETIYTTEQVLSTPLTADVKYTAVYEKDAKYIEPLASVEFATVPTNGLLTMGADADTYADNTIKVKLIGEIGSDLAELNDERVTDLNVEWEFDGFRHIVSKAQAGENAATTDAADSNEYCDSYGKAEKVDATSVNFKLRSMPFNFYGQVKAKVTYNGKEITISNPLAVVPTKTATAGTLLPKAGYVSNYDWYSDDMVGYKTVTSPDNKTSTEYVTGDWTACGGNAGRGLYIASENGKKFLQLNSTGTKSSSFAVNKLDTAPTGQVIISQDVRFYNNNSSILFKQDNPVTWGDNSTAVSLNFTGTGFNLNGGENITDATTGVWYKVVIAADVTSKLCYASIYDEEGTLLGSSDVMPFVNAGAAAPVYLCYRTPDNSAGKLDFNNTKMYVPEIDDSTFKTTIENETLSIPENSTDAPVTTNLTVSAKSTEGYEMVGEATWAVADDATGVTVTPDAENSHSAVLSVANGAQAGEVTVKVTLGGVTKEIKVTLSSSQDSVNFTQKTASISIPLVEGESNDYTYQAAVVNKDGAAIEGKTVTYAMYDKNNTTEITDENALTGISFNKETGVLTVTSAARATTVYIRATGTNSADETITRAQKVTIHGLAFDFGTAGLDAVVEGYTAVAADTTYSDSTGYGISSGSPAANGTASTEDADADSLKGSFTFKAKVVPQKVYNVTINYSGNVAAEYVNADLTGIAYVNSSKNSVTYTISVIDDVLDLAFTNAEVSSIVIEKQSDKLASAKPNVYTVGDSTIANNGSWAYVLARDYASKYADLADIATFSNTGRGGKNLSSYYTGGELNDRVLTQIRPGDYVMIGDMGTNGMGSKYEESFNYYIDACEAMGAKVILNSYSPHGAVGGYTSGYDSTTNTFTSYRQDEYDNIVRKIYAERTDAANEKYDANIIGFVDIGKMADAAFNAYVQDYAANGFESANAAAQDIIKCFSDHNHYSNGTIAAKLMIEGYGDGADAKGIVKSLVEILKADLAKGSGSTEETTEPSVTE